MKQEGDRQDGAPQSRVKMLTTTIKKLYRRGAKNNIQRILVKAHTADIAEMLESLETGENVEVFRLEPSLDKRAEVLSYLKPEVQREILVMLDDEEARNLVSRMETDDAADLLGQMPKELADRILTSMEREDFQEVTDLMGYADDTAGGLMSSDFLALKQNLTVSEAIREIQSQEDESVIMIYLYVVDDNNKLVGVLSLKQLLLARPTHSLQDIMSTEVTSVKLETDQEEVAKIVERYDFLAVPVIDAQGALLGVITVDDVIDVIREEAEEDLLAMGRTGGSLDMSTWENIRARFPWLVLAFVGGICGFFMIYAMVISQVVQDDTRWWWYAAAAIPLVLTLGATAGSQSVAMAVGALRGKSWGAEEVRAHLFKESKIGLSLAVFFPLLCWILSYFVFSVGHYGAVIGLAVGLQVFLSVCLGALVPYVVKQSGFEPTTVSTALYAVITEMTAILILFGLVHVFIMP